jgi:glycosyltransferase involved in cell wall biosynthesis
VRIAYLVNQSPQPSHSFIRREIAALESLGHTISRFTLRRFDGSLADPRDERERDLTQVVLDRGAVGLATDSLRSGTRLLSGVATAWRSSRRMANRRAVYGIYLAEAAALKRMLEAQNVEHVHAHFGTNSAEVARLCHRLGGPPFSFTVHGPEEFDQPIALNLNGKVRDSRFAIAISSFGRSRLWRWCDLADWDKVHIVHCGVDETFLDDLTNVPPAGGHRFTCVGRLAEQKGQMVLVRAARLLRDMGRTFHIDLLGEGPLRRALEAEILRLDLSRHITLHGLASGDQVRQRMLESRATLLPSFAEGLPVVLMESLALRRPCIATTVAGIPELLTLDCGKLVPAGDPQRLCDAMMQLLDASPDQLAAMGDEGRRRVLERHDARSEAKKLADLLATADNAASPS